MMIPSPQSVLPPRRTLLLAVLLVLVLTPLSAHAFIEGALTDAGNAVAGFFLDTIAANIFEWGKALFLKIIEWTILDFSTYWEGGIGDNLEYSWQMVRDVVNLLIVVLFIVTAILTVFGEFAFKRKILLGLLVAALFVNFSAFFTLALFDISHALFVAIFTLLDAQTLSSLSPFSGYDSSLTQIRDGATWNIFYALVITVISLFLFLGFLWFSVILIERFIVSLFLVVLSPLAVLGFFLKRLGDGKSFGVLIRFSDFWENKLFHTLVTPVVLIFGFMLLMELFLSVHGQILTPDNLPKLLGPEAWEILLQLSVAGIILVIGMFLIGRSIGKISGWTPGISDRIGKQVRAITTLNRGRAAVGALRNAYRRINPPPADGRTWASMKREAAKDIGIRAKSYWKGEVADADGELKKRRESRIARRGIGDSTREAIRSGDLESRLYAAKNNVLTDGQFRVFAGDKDLRETLAGNTNLGAGQLRNLIRRTGPDEIGTLIAAINHSKIDTEGLDEIAGKKFAEDSADRSRVKFAIDKKRFETALGKSPDNLSDGEKMKFVNEAIAVVTGKGADPDKRKAALEVLNRYSKDKSVRIKNTIAGMKFGEITDKDGKVREKPMDKDVFEKLAEDAGPHVIQTLINRKDVGGNRERLVFIEEKNPDMNQRLSRMIEDLKKKLDGGSDRAAPGGGGSGGRGYDDENITG